MSKLLVTTESGSQYLLDLEYGFWMKKGVLAQNNRIWEFKSFRQDNAPADWDALHALPEATAPVIGERMYLNGRDEWRISTAVKSVEEIDG